MIRIIFSTVVILLTLMSSVSAKEMSKGGGYSFCKEQLKIEFPHAKVNAKLIKIQYSPKKKARKGITHDVLIRVSGIEASAYKVRCLVTRDQDVYTAMISKQE